MQAERGLSFELEIGCYVPIPSVHSPFELYDMILVALEMTILDLWGVNFFVWLRHSGYICDKVAG